MTVNTLRRISANDVGSMTPKHIFRSRSTSPNAVTGKRRTFWHGSTFNRRRPRNELASRRSKQRAQPQHSHSHSMKNPNRVGYGWGRRGLGNLPF